MFSTAYYGPLVLMFLLVLLVQAIYMYVYGMHFGAHTTQSHGNHENKPMEPGESEEPLEP
jgi:hypothetical protein